MKSVAILLVAILAQAFAVSDVVMPSRVRREALAAAEFQIAQELALQGKSMPQPGTMDVPQGFVTVDLRSHTYGLRPVENQGNCGSCWTFGTSHTYSDYFRLKGCATPMVSEQHVLNCASGSCSGGYPSSVWSMFNSGGFTNTGCLPYRTAKHACTGLCESGAKITWETGHIGYTCTTSVATMVSWLNAGYPMQVQLNLQKQFYNFGTYSVATTTVYPKSGWDATIIGGHAMEIVGYGTLNGEAFWLLKNSWASSWGWNGFVMIRKGVNEGNIESWGACRPTTAGCEPTFAGKDGAAAEPQAEDFVTFDTDNSTGTQPGGAAQAGGFSPMNDLTDSLLVESAQFAAYALLAATPDQGGYGCVPPLPTLTFDNNTGEAMNESAQALQDFIGQSQITLYNANQQVTAGNTYNFLFTFSTSTASCASLNPGGTYQATVYVTHDGIMVLDNIYASSPPSNSAANTAAIIGGTVAAIVVVAAAGAFFFFRWRKSKVEYNKLQEVHSEVVRRVTVLESGPAGAAVREAALSQLLTTGQLPDQGTVQATGPAVQWHQRPSAKLRAAPASPSSAV